MNIKAQKSAIVSKLQTQYPKIKIEVRDISNLLTHPEGRIVVVYVGNDVNKTNAVAYETTEKFEVNILFRDPLASEDVLEMIDTIRELLHALKINGNDYERLYYQGCRLEEFVPETSVYAYKLTFACVQEKAASVNI